MARPRKDGSTAAQTNKRALSELYIRRVKPQAAPFNAWDTKEPGLVLRVHPTGSRSFKVVYSYHSRKRWYHVGMVPLSDARRIATKIRLAVAEGIDPVADRQAERGAGSFGELVQRYLDEYARKKNKSWEQADYLVKRHLLPRWGKLEVKGISRADVRAALARITSPTVANQVRAAASAIFSWAVKQEVIAVNPVTGIERHETKDRERVLGDTELPLFWKAFDSAGLVKSSALKTILLTGQRPGEVSCMRREHIKDGWWEMPGDPVPALAWPGTKNEQTHRVFLSEPVRDIIAELDEEATTGFVFATSRGKAITELPRAMQDICRQIGADRATPHDLRRTFSTQVTRLGFGRDSMNRVTNHREGGIADVYDRHRYSVENQKIMDAVASHILALAEGKSLESDNVVEFRQAQG
jgi:integrase